MPPSAALTVKIFIPLQLSIAIQNSGKNLADTIYAIKIDGILNGACKENNRSTISYAKNRFRGLNYVRGQGAI